MNRRGTIGFDTLPHVLLAVTNGLSLPLDGVTMCRSERFSPRDGRQESRRTSSYSQMQLGKVGDAVGSQQKWVELGLEPPEVGT